MGSDPESENCSRHYMHNASFHLVFSSLSPLSPSRLPADFFIECSLYLLTQQTGASLVHFLHSLFLHPASPPLPHLLALQLQQTQATILILMHTHTISNSAHSVCVSVAVLDLVPRKGTEEGWAGGKKRLQNNKTSSRQRMIENVDLGVNEMKERWGIIGEGESEMMTSSSSSFIPMPVCLLAAEIQ